MLTGTEDIDGGTLPEANVPPPPSNPNFPPTGPSYPPPPPPSYPPSRGGGGGVGSTGSTNNGFAQINPGIKPCNFGFQPAADIRRAIYTTNAIEAMHLQIRKVTKTKGAFTSDQALLKLVYLTVKEISKKWTMPIRNWGLTMQQLHIKFGDRIKAFGNFF